MAENKDTPRASDQQISEAQRTSNALAEAAAKADERRMDETVPGGRYKTADGRTVNANGDEIKD